MTDCTNGEIRDLLPEYIHGTLSADARQRVEAHVADCPPCTDESALLRRIRASLSAAPAVNVAAIVAALPPSPALRSRLVASASSPRRAWHAQPWLRVAAGLVLAVGAGSLFFSRLDNGAVATVDPLPVATAPSAVVADATPESVASTRAPRAAAELTTGVSDDLSDDELRGLLDDIEKFKGLPAEESEDVVRGLRGTNGVESGL